MSNIFVVIDDFLIDKVYQKISNYITSEYGPTCFDIARFLTTGNLVCYISYVVLSFLMTKSVLALFFVPVAFITYAIVNSNIRNIEHSVLKGTANVHRFVDIFVRMLMLVGFLVITWLDIIEAMADGLDLKVTFGVMSSLCLISIFYFIACQPASPTKKHQKSTSLELSPVRSR